MPLLADLVLLLHFLFVLFVVGSLPLIWIGAGLGWPWVRRYGFRVAHVCAIGVVVAESLIGMMCPLTVWEDALRQAGRPEASFIQRWVGRLLYYELPESVFTAIYVLFALLVVVTFRLVRPERRPAA